MVHEARANAVSEAEEELNGRRMLRVLVGDAHGLDGANRVDNFPGSVGRLQRDNRSGLVCIGAGTFVLGQPHTKRHVRYTDDRNQY